MPLWGNTDQDTKSAIFAPAQVQKAPTAAERDALYNNTTANGYGTKATVGMYGVDKNEVVANRLNRLPRAPGGGWVLRTTGSGARAGRIQNELLVAMHIGVGGSGDEDTAFPDYSLSFSIQPAASVSGNATANESTKFNSNAISTPTGATITFQWQKWGGASFANVAAAGAYSNVTTKQLSVNAAVAANGEIYRNGAYDAASITVFSTNTVFIKTT